MSSRKLSEQGRAWPVIFAEAEAGVDGDAPVFNFGRGAGDICGPPFIDNFDSLGELDNLDLLWVDSSVMLAAALTLAALREIVLAV